MLLVSSDMQEGREEKKVSERFRHSHHVQSLMITESISLLSGY
jgi:hypothetical protein